MIQKIDLQENNSEKEINLNSLNNKFSKVFVFDSNNQSDNDANNKLIALGAVREFSATDEQFDFENLEKFIDEKSTWIIGCISYDVKNNIERLNSINIENIDFPLVLFFEPLLLIQINILQTTLYFDDNFFSVASAHDTLQTCFSSQKFMLEEKNNFILKQRITKGEYLDNVNQLKQNIKSGNIYEVNYCQEFYATNCKINPANVFKKLNSISEAPMALYGKISDHYILCSSPERYLKKIGNKLISQPIKGTAKRAEDKIDDEEIKLNLRNSEKEKSENIMIVDIVRNDLSRIAERGSVSVEELCEIYSFKQVHQLISTVSCEIKKEVTFCDIIKSTFPMGSMTGAPKISAMKLIDKYEKTKRGLYSGTVGYIMPNGDFDFNVVIRTILFNEKTNYVSLMVGGAITDNSISEDEYEECLLKAKALVESLETN